MIMIDIMIFANPITNLYFRKWRNGHKCSWTMEFFIEGVLMLNQLFINTVILIAVTFVIGHILNEIPEGKINTYYGKITIGIFGGFTGILLLVYSISVYDNNTFIDLRAYAIMMASYFGGTIPTLISACIIALYRVLYSGLSIASAIAVLRVILYVILFHIIDKKVMVGWKKWLYKSMITLLIVVSTDYYLLIDVEKVYIILFEYSVIHIFAGILEYFLLDYVTTSNQLFRMYKKDSTKDFLTGLYNTRQFDKMINIAFERVQHNNETLSCLMVDIDHFKKINDTYGHSIGDIVLKELAEILMSNSRGVDVVSRVGGEEFCVLLMNCPKSQTFDIALGINKAVQEHKFTVGNNQFTNITVSIGLSVYPETVLKLDELKEKADNALYTAKRTGRNRVCDNVNCILS